jgi:cyclopropane-fatty-acyl-phospholipid synthase
MAPTTSRPVLSDVLAVPVAYLRDKLSTLTTGPAIALAKPAIFSLLSRVEVGTLILIDEHSGERHVFGQPPPPTGNPPCVTLTVYDAQFYLRLLLHADMGFAAAYLLHQVTCSDLTAFFQLFILNRDALNNGVVVTTPGSTLGWLFSPVTLVTTAVSSLLLNHSTKTTTGKGTKNTIDGAKVNISAHYDLGNDIFAAFLSPDMTYSCPIWGPVTPTQITHTTKPANGNCNGTRTGKRDGDGEDLESAQLRKLHHIISLARLKPTDHVLEIGTGWGSFAIEAVKLAGCRVTTLTLSREQKALAEERIASKGFEDKITVLLMDYRDEALPVPEGGFDKVVSIEMLEAVGSEFLGAYFARVHRVLRKDRGIAVFQCITMPEGRQEAYERREE